MQLLLTDVQYILYVDHKFTLYFQDCLVVESSFVSFVSAFAKFFR